MNQILLEIDPDSVVDDFGGVHARGERKFYTKAEANSLLNLEYGGRPVFRACAPAISTAPSSDEGSE